MDLANGSPCLIDPNDPTHYGRFLAEIGFSCRQRGKLANEKIADSLQLFFSFPGYQECRTKWKGLTRLEQEERLLETLASMARTDEHEGNEFAHEGFVRRSRRLTPEITLSSLCADEGDGLLRWLDLVEEYTRDSTKLGERPIPNEQFFTKFAIPFEGSLPSIPLSQADRAFQTEYLLRRHSLLFQFTRRLMVDILGLEEELDHKSSGKVGNIRSEITSNNDPFLADEGEFGESGPLPKRYGFICQEDCSLCDKTGTFDLASLGFVKLHRLFDSP